MVKNENIPKRIITWLIALAAFVLVAYNSVYVKKLSTVKASAAARYFNPTVYARNYLDKRLPLAIERALPLTDLFSSLKTGKDSLFEKYGHALGIGNIRYFLVKGTGKVASLNEDDILISLTTDSGAASVRLATVFVFGNAVRDASGLIDINDFSNTMDFNNVSAEINKIIRTEILPPFVKSVNKGDSLNFVAALELNKVHVNTNNLTLIPIRLNSYPLKK